MSNQAALTFAEVAAQSEVSLSTLRRRQRNGEFPDAFKDDSGRWRVPVTNLHVAGIKLTPQRNHEQSETPAAAAAVEPSEVVELRQRIKLLETELRAEREKSELLRQSLADLRSALRAIEPPKREETEAEQPSGEAPAPASSEPRRPWLSRLFGG